MAEIFLDEFFLVSFSEFGYFGDFWRFRVIFSDFGDFGSNPGKKSRKNPKKIRKNWKERIKNPENPDKSPEISGKKSAKNPEGWVRFELHSDMPRTAPRHAFFRIFLSD